jgi:hypothetical protein
MSKLQSPSEQAIWRRWDAAAAAIRWPNQGEAVTWIYISPNGSRWDLEGRYRGRQGVRMMPVLGGAYHLPFEQLFTESAYQVGSTYERTNINKRVIKMGVIIGGTGISSHQYRMIEANWWDAWPHDKPGWLGCHTRFGGWRWAQVRLAEPINSPIDRDPTNFRNNVQTWNMSIVSTKPWYAKRTLHTTWTPHAKTIDEHGTDQESVAIANRGHLPVAPLFLVKGPGKAWVQDGMTDRLVALPTLTADDGYVLVDTDPANRTLTGSSDPVDNVFYSLVRQSRILDFLLHDIAALGLPVWRRANGIRFTSTIPPRTVANITVKHDNPDGAITVLLPQRFIRPS